VPKITLQEDDYLLLPENTLIGVKVSEIEVVEIPGKDGKKPWEKINFKFIIKSAPAAYDAAVGSPIWGGIGFRFSLNPDNQLYQWVSALLGGLDLQVGFELDTDLLIGREAKALTTQYPKKNGGFGHRVDSLLPATVGAAANLAPAPAPAPAPAVPAFGWMTDPPASVQPGLSEDIPF